MLTRLFAGMLMLVTLVGVAVVSTLQSFAAQNGQTLPEQVALLVEILNPNQAGVTPLRDSDLRQFLPEPEVGWRRLEWNEFAEKHLTRNDSGAPIQTHLPELDSLLNLERLMGGERRKQGVWVYAGHGKLLSIQVTQSRLAGPGGGRHDQGALTDRAGSQLPRYALIRGVRYALVPDISWDGKAAKFRQIRARLGNGVTIEVRAIADDAAVKSYLRRIDYDGLLAAIAPLRPQPDRAPGVTRLIGGETTAGPRDTPGVRINRGLRPSCDLVPAPAGCQLEATDSPF